MHRDERKNTSINAVGSTSLRINMVTTMSAPLSTSILEAFEATVKRREECDIAHAKRGWWIWWELREWIRLPPTLPTLNR